MTTNKGNNFLEIIHPVCCGLDIHKKVIVACLITVGSNGQKVEHIREFSSFTDSLLCLKAWLAEHECPIVAMESTGVYWRPVHNILEHNVEIILVNARHYKNVPGRKTDVGDSKWLAGLLQVGLLKGSFIPREEVRQWRELVWIRTTLVNSESDYKRRVHKLFETANIKIDSVVSDLFGMTGMNLMLYLCGMEEPTLEGVKKCACGSLRKKTDELFRSIQGFFKDHHRFILCSLLRVISDLEREIEVISTRIRLRMKEKEELIERLDVVPGINETAAQKVLGVIGDDLSSFKNEDAISLWCGVCPGNNQSGGKQFSGKSSVKKHPLKEVLIEIAWAAIKKKGSYYKLKYHKLKARRGAKRAITAIAHRILKAVYFIIKDGASYKELGEDYLNKKSESQKIQRLKQQAKSLGFELQPVI